MLINISLNRYFLSHLTAFTSQISNSTGSPMEYQVKKERMYHVTPERRTIPTSQVSSPLELRPDVF
jgi:hypothetical protein